MKVKAHCVFFCLNSFAPWLKLALNLEATASRVWIADHKPVGFVVVVVCFLSCFCFICLLEAGFHRVTQADLRLSILLLQPLSAGITGMHHCSWLMYAVWSCLVCC